MLALWQRFESLWASESTIRVASGPARISRPTHRCDEYKHLKHVLRKVTSEIKLSTGIATSRVNVCPLQCLAYLAPFN